MLTTVQRERLQTLHSYEWAHEDPRVTRSNLQNLFDQIDSAEELWYASFIVRWEPENGDLDFVLKHPCCDRGIALFLYWALAPTALDPHDSKPNSLPSLYLPIFRNLEQHLLSGHYPSGQIAFTPLALRNQRPEFLAQIPDELKQQTPGMELPLDYSRPVFHPQD